MRRIIDNLDSAHGAAVLADTATDAGIPVDQGEVICIGEHVQTPVFVDGNQE